MLIFYLMKLVTRGMILFHRLATHIAGYEFYQFEMGKYGYKCLCEISMDSLSIIL